MFSDRHENMKYLLMAKSAEEGKKYLKDNDKHIKASMIAGYATICIGGYIMANEEDNPKKVAFILSVKIDCLPCPIYEKCIAKIIAEGCLEIEEIEDGILAIALNMKSTSVEHH